MLNRHLENPHQNLSVVRSLFFKSYNFLFSTFLVIHILASALLGWVTRVSLVPETIQREKERHDGLNQVQSAYGDHPKVQR